MMLGVAPQPWPTPRHPAVREDLIGPARGCYHDALPFTTGTAMLLHLAYLRCAALSLALCLAALPTFAAEDAAPNGNGNHVIGPDYKIDPDLTDKGNPKGKSFEFTMKLAESKIFRGDDATLNPKKMVRTERKIFVYVPAAYKDGTKAPVLVTL